MSTTASTKDRQIKVIKIWWSLFVSLIQAPSSTTHHTKAPELSVGQKDSIAKPVESTAETHLCLRP